MAATRDTIEHATSGRATCRVCKTRIEKGALRFGKVDFGFSEDGSYRWYHLACAWAKRKKLVQKLIDTHGGDLPVGPAELALALEAEAPAPKTPGDHLPPDARTALVAAYRHDDEAALDELRGRLGDAAVRTFVWEHVEAWERAGAKIEGKWALRALARELARDDGLAMRTAPLVEAMVRARRYEAVESFLDLLASIGTTGALLAIHRVASRYAYKGADNLAREVLERVAEERGLSFDELEDRLAPTVEPEPDEREAVFRMHSRRLERALSSRRSWSVADFDAFVRKQPFVSQIARRLVWSAIDADGTRVATFLVDDAGGLVDAAYDAVTLPENVRIRLVHAAELDEEERRSWIAVLGDYQIISPFAQLDRPLFEMDPKDRKRKSLRVLPETSVAPGPLHGVLNEAGWEKGREENGVIRWFYKRFADFRVTGVLKIAPGLDRAGKVRAHQRVEEVFFIEKKRLGWGEIERIPPTEVPAIAISEVLRDVGELALSSSEPKKPS